MPLSYSNYLTCKFLSLAMILPWCAGAQTTYPVSNNQDILHYTFNISLSDTSDEIIGQATILYTLKNEQKLVLDLIGLKTDGSGMVVDSIIVEGISLPYVHEHDRLIITNDNEVVNGQTYKAIIYYRGVAAAGLIITNNKFGERVFFGDNYPDRARNWLPCVDHPADKAMVTWVITAPEHYKIVASGKLVSEAETKQNIITTTWHEQVPLSTKVMAFGAANFAVDHTGEVNNIPVTTWVFKQNMADGFKDFAIATKILAYYDSLIGPYPYEKLANVQSKTTYGGLENAGNIFYSEQSVNGLAEIEELIAHEIVHQWFGNSVTEKDWPHAWLSEGFATYLENVYIGSRYGQREMNRRISAERRRVINYWHRKPIPIVNYNLISYPRVANLSVLLSPNTYQKAGWVLHMLRNEIGEALFWQSIRKYYTDFRDSIASTTDFQNVIEEVTGKDLQPFFDQWFYGMGQPVLKGSWQFTNNKIVVAINQSQEKPFVFPLDIGLVYGDEIVMKSVLVNSTFHSFNFSAKRPDRVILDPNTMLLFEGQSILLNK